LEDKNRTEEASNNIFVHSFDNNKSWIWAIPFSDGSTSVGIVGDKEKIMGWLKMEEKNTRSSSGFRRSERKV
jgi:flavin-dependent dehydrogenase